MPVLNLAMSFWADALLISWHLADSKSEGHIESLFSQIYINPSSAVSGSTIVFIDYKLSAFAHILAL